MKPTRKPRKGPKGGKNKTDNYVPPRTHAPTKIRLFNAPEPTANEDPNKMDLETLTPEDYSPDWTSPIKENGGVGKESYPKSSEISWYKFKDILCFTRSKTFNPNFNVNATSAHVTSDASGTDLKHMELCFEIKNGSKLHQPTGNPFSLIPLKEVNFTPRYKKVTYDDITCYLGLEGRFVRVYRTTRQARD
eukprot:TRINITY_DN25257_c0_g1_i1.p1 TRINITY_DN25257_c0_g1~~TRINITY_DN25257_c0_g1_i1.p1  ORF type:complete len:191 (-),score=20.74 TRINITY_DN25257_c0_g1_i1:505-1077(-)